MANLEKYKGVIPAFYACYDAEGNVSPERVRALTEYHIRKGVKGVYVNGSSGECIYQSLEDRKITLENVMAAAKGRLTVIAHVGCNNTKDSVELAKHAESLGVDAIASIPPIYFHLPEYAIAAYWNAMSQAAPNTDFIIYNIPQLAGGDDYIIFNGPDEQFISGRVIGAEAGIGGTYGVMPELFLKMDELVKAGKMEEAMRVQYAANDIIYKMCSGHGNMYGMIKEMLRINESLDLGGVREPLPQLIDSDLAIAQEAARMVKEAVAAYC